MDTSLKGAEKKLKKGVGRNTKPLDPRQYDPMYDVKHLPPVKSHFFQPDM